MLKKIRKLLKQQEGFTLVELMIVVVILGILSGIGVQQYGKIQRKAKIAAHNANVRIITSAANMYLMVNQSVPEGGLSVQKLKEDGYLQEEPTNPFGSKEDDPTYGGPYELTVTAPEGDSQFTIEVEPGAYRESES